MADHTFICYAREDTDFVLALARKIRTRGVRMWLDQWDIRGGMKWNDAIDDAIEDCAAFLIVLSAASVASDEVQGELRRALDLGKLIVPVIREECEIPRQLLTLQHVRFPSGKADDEAALTELSVALPSARPSWRRSAGNLAKLPFINAQTGGRHSVLAAAGLVLLTNATAIVISLPNIREVLFGIVGNRVLGVALYVLMFLTVLGYVLAYLWANAHVRGTRPVGNRGRTLMPLLVLFMAGGLMSANVVLYPSLPAPRVVLEDLRSEWTDWIYSLQAANGGTKTDNEIATLPDPWTTAQGLKAVLAGGKDLSPNVNQVRRGLAFLESVRESNGGWGYFHFPDRPREYTITAVTAWVTIAYLESLDAASVWSAEERVEIVDRVVTDLERLVALQDASGGWSPINHIDPSHTRTYTSVMALWALVEAKLSASVSREIGDRWDQPMRNAVNWLLSIYREDLAWVPNPHRDRQTQHFLGLTAQALFVLHRAEEVFPNIRTNLPYREAQRRFLTRDDLADRPLNRNDRFSDVDQYLPPLDFQLQGSTMLWYPWTLVAAGQMASDESLEPEYRVRASAVLSTLLSRSREVALENRFAPAYQVAENLFALSLVPTDPER